MVKRKHDTKWMVGVALMAAIVVLLANTPLGMIQLPVTKATTVHIPVILGAVVFGPGAGALLGGVFGICSVISNTITPALTSFAFSPFIPVPGMDRGSVWALVICLLPRIMVGITPDLVYRFINWLLENKHTISRTVSMVVASIVGSFTNTVLVMGLIFVVFKDAYAAMNNIPVDAVLGVILGVVATNGVPEAIVAAIITPAICLPLRKALKLD